MTPQDRRTPQGSPRTWIGTLALVAVLVASVGAASGGLALPTEVLGLSALAGLVLGLFATVYAVRSTEGAVPCKPAGTVRVRCSALTASTL